MQTFKIENINIPPVEVRSHLKDDGLLELHTQIMGVIKTEIVALHSQAIRDTLISLGWTPPETGHAIKNVIARMRNDDGIVDYWIKELRDAINQTDPAHE